MVRCASGDEFKVMLRVIMRAVQTPEASQSPALSCCNFRHVVLALGSSAPRSRPLLSYISVSKLATRPSTTRDFLRMALSSSRISRRDETIVVSPWKVELDALGR